MRSFVEQLKSRLLISTVVSEHVRLTKRGRDLWGVCPFHKEQTPSFVVHDDKGRYHCFGCGVDGDAITFLATIRNLSFREALTELAEKVGMTLPDRPVESAQEKRVQNPLYSALETGNRWFQEQLTRTAGSPARDYLASRGLSLEAASKFQLGWAPQGPLALGDFLSSQKISLSVQEDAGLIFPPQGSLPGRDRFRARLTFPIHDEKGRVIGFGGRTLANQEPKYLNSPETAVFLKNQNLYGLWQAKQDRSLTEKPLVLVEGYLDVIALQTAGLARAFAPLGTALGDVQLLKAWRLSPIPLVCFDGDAAGETAATRTALRALPLLKPGFSLDFCHLPAGEDPQSLLFQGQKEVLQKAFLTAVPLVDLLWSHLQKSVSLKTPESQAAFKKQYKDWCALIQDSEVRHLYGRAFDGRFYEETRLKTHSKNASKSFSALPKATKGPPPQTVLLEQTKQTLQMKILLLTLIHHPSLIREFSQSLEALSIPSPTLDEIRWALLRLSEEESLDLCGEKINVETYLEERGLTNSVSELLETSGVLQHAFFAKKETDEQEARLGFQDVLTHYQREANLKHEIEEAQATFARGMHEKSWRRLQKLKEIYVQLG